MRPASILLFIAFTPFLFAPQAHADGERTYFVGLETRNIGPVRSIASSPDRTTFTEIATFNHSAGTAVAVPSWGR